MKKLSICIPCYNEEKNIGLTINLVREEMSKLKNYNYEIIFSDNASEDNTQMILKKLAKEDKKIKIIINNRNFGARRSMINCISHATGDVVISMVCDLQTPISLISEFVHYWEEGSSVIFAQKIKSKENKLKYFLRTIYYKIIAGFSEAHQHEHVSGLALYDKNIIKVICEIGDQMSYTHLIAELGYDVKLVSYVQEKRTNGKSSFNVARYFDYAISSLVTTSTVPLHIATVAGCIASVISFIIGLIYLIFKLIYWSNFTAGMAPMIIGMFFLGSIQLLFIGLLGEYIASIIKKLSKIPTVIEKELINFD